MLTAAEISQKRNEIFRIAQEHGVKNIKLFGSVLKKENQPDSDIDFLIEFEEGRSLFDFIAMQRDLENLLGKKVDLSTTDSLHWKIYLIQVVHSRIEAAFTSETVR
ncbi:nucleotidyltransferase family protein [Natribacillus halophilus]|uniref:Polymerase nucleotidyl transferase domain-containing protein n=1 Tax=Natribacillus halophilus TaxID=549003 RepID=A0A1G8KPV1_9BACI|nr:nucleotidyltransferase family protein [Natribacillus halophilus]SDI45437.1 hypothetical protein SAMN04488123_102235 [Natribacillus halophilus]